MKKFVLLILILIFQSSFAVAQDYSVIYKENNRFGLKDLCNNIIIEPVYKKIIRLGDNSYLVQNRWNKFGIISQKGEEIVKPKYKSAERILGEYAKLGNDNDYGIYDSCGNLIIPHEYDSISLLYGKMFLVYQDYQYGIIDFEGNVLLENKFDDIYMPAPNIIRLQYLGNWYEIEQKESEELTLPKDMETIRTNKDFTVTDLLTTTTAMSGYSVLTFTDYIIKMFSSISPAHEQTVDDLMFSQGTDSIGIIMKFSWLPKYPYTYLKNYINIIRNPNNGVFSEARTKLKNKM